MDAVNAEPFVDDSDPGPATRDRSATPPLPSLSAADAAAQPATDAAPGATPSETTPPADVPLRRRLSRSRRTLWSTRRNATADESPRTDAASRTADTTGTVETEETEERAEESSEVVAENAVVAADAAPQSPASDAQPAVVVRGLSKSFGETHAVDRIDLEIPPGSFFGVVGPNGAGKTTTLSMIAGLLRPDAGTISVAGIDLAADPRAAKRQVGILPDRLRTFERLTGRQLLSYYGLLRGLEGAVVEKRATDLARAFDITDALTRPVSDYSSGMTKKIMLAGAMIHSPRVLVLDEPFEAMDPVSASVILRFLGAYVAHGGTVVLSSHGLEFVERVCSGVAVIVGGQVLASGTLDQVRGDLTLEQRFLQLSGGMNDVEGLEWLHSFSD